MKSFQTKTDGNIFISLGLVGRLQTFIFGIEKYG